MEELVSLFEQYGYIVVAVALLVEQVGAPVPAFPVLVVAGALVAQGKLSGPAIAALAVAVVVAGDLLWFQFGRRYGSRILALICRVSLSPDRCVSQTEQVFAVLGLRSLLVARFVPGLSAVAPSMAGLSGYTRWRFVLFDGLGALIWALTAIGIGMVFEREVGAALDALDALGANALVLLFGLAALFVAWKAWRRRRLRFAGDVPRLTAEELERRLASAEPPLVLDLRSALVRAAEPAPLPDVVPVEPGEAEQVLAQLHPRGDVVVVCACPGEAQAASVAARLRSAGWHAFALQGGFTAWVLSRGAAPAADAPRQAGRAPG